LKVTNKRLVLTDGIRERELQLAGRIVVGRDPSCEISHDHALLSRRHAEFLTVGDTVTLRDLGSRLGVFVNGERSMERVLEPGDVVQIGPLRARFVLDDTPTRVMVEAVDGDRTAIIRKVFAAGELRPDTLAGLARAADDDEVTRLVPAPRLSTAGEKAEQPYFQRPAGHDDASSFMRPAETPRAGRAQPPRPDPALFHSILMPVLLLAMLIAGTAALPMLIALPIAWLAVPVVLALAGSYAVSLSIKGRISEALAARERERT